MIPGSADARSSFTSLPLEGIAGEHNASCHTGGFMGHVTVSLRADPDGSVRVNRGARPASTVYGPRRPRRAEPSGMGSRPASPVYPRRPAPARTTQTTGPTDPTVPVAKPR